MDHEELDKLINELADLRKLAASGHRRWVELGQHSRVIGQAFNSTQYPTKDQKDAARARFKGILEDIMAGQEWAMLGKETRSEERRKDILRSAYLAKTCYQEYGIVDLFIPRVSDRKEELIAASKNMQEAWRLWKEHKHELLGKDKKDVFAELRSIQDGLDLYWSEYKKAKAKAREEYAARVEERIAKLEERLAAKYDQKARCESRIEDHQEKLADAWSDGFRDRVGGWLAEDEERLQHINDAIDRLESWLEEERERLGRLR